MIGSILFDRTRQTIFIPDVPRFNPFRVGGWDGVANPGLHPELAMLNPFRVPEKEPTDE